jgi:DNA-directed RNA polymerase specialized sigma subunit
VDNAADPATTLQPEDYFNAWQAKPGPQTLTPLLSAVEPTIEKAIKTYGYQNDPTIKSTAQLHVIKVLPRFDPTKSKLNTFLTNELQRVKRLGAQQEAIPMPESAGIDFQSLNESKNELQETLGREPTTEELADQTGLSVSRIVNLSQRYGLPSVTGSTPGMSDVAEVKSDEDNNNEMWLDAVYDELDPVNQKIMEWSTGRNKSPVLSKTEMAKNLNMSVSAVTQRANKIADKVEAGSMYRIL